MHRGLYVDLSAPEIVLALLVELPQVMAEKFLLAGRCD